MLNFLEKFIRRDKILFWSAIFLTLALSLSGYKAGVRLHLGSAESNSIENKISQNDFIDKTSFVDRIIGQFREVAVKEDIDSNSDKLVTQKDSSTVAYNFSKVGGYSNRVIVKFAAGSTLASRESFVEENSLEVVSEPIGENWGFYSVKDPLLTVGQLELLNLSESVNYVEPDYLHYISDAIDDNKNGAGSEYIVSRFSEQWGMKNTQNRGIDINIESAWKKTRGSEDIVVAVIDSGIDSGHKNLKDRIVLGKNFANENQDVVDIIGHGTTVAGVIASNDTQGDTVGVAPRVKIMPLKISDSSNTLKYSSLIQAIEYAVKNNVSVINISRGFYTRSEGIKDALVNAGTANIPVVTSAGNESNNNDTKIRYPSYFSKELPNVIAVANIQKDGHLASSTNYGITTVNFAAPGSNILTTDKGGGYCSASGTSYSAPYVSGIIALMRSINYSYTPQQIRDILEFSVKKLPHMQDKLKVGGIVNAGRAVEIIAQNKNTFTYMSNSS